MTNHPINILGLSIGTRKIGIVVLKGKELIEWETHLFAGWWSEAKGNAILARYEKYVVRNAITNIAIKVPPVIPPGSALEYILQEVQALADRYRCKTMLYTREDLKQHSHLHHSNSLLEYAVLQYPMLRPEYVREKESKTQYHQKMFEAVVAAELFRLKAKE